jgi:hypothetical protein
MLFVHSSLRNWSAGVAMATPFYAEFVPWLWAVSLSLPFFLGILLNEKNWRAPRLAVLPFLMLLILHIAALGFTHSSFEYQIIKDILIAAWLLAIYVLSSDDAIDGFLLALIPLAFISAVLGLGKAALLDRGYLLGPLLNSCNYYPAGSALCINYNNLGLLWLMAILGCMRRRWWIIIPILITAGALSSSRRFLLLLPLLFGFLLFDRGREVVAKSLLISLTSVAIVYLVSDPQSFERFRFGDEPYTVLLQNWSVFGLGFDPINVNRSAPSVMLGTLTDGALGASSRLSFWKLGLTEAGWIPRGWTYHEIFSCEFSSCDVFHYPHMSILSEWIIGGAAFGFIALMFYLWPTWLIWREGALWSLALIVVAMPYSLISGDTVFSLPLYLACMLTALSSVPRKPLF